MALISLQTQEGFLGAGNYGISRMNGGFASRPAIGVVPKGHWGQRWARDVRTLLTHRKSIVDKQGLKDAGGICLVWLQPWDGETSLSFGALDPWYIEICRRIRLVFRAGTPAAYAITTGSKASRIDAKSRNGLTGDPWMPIDIVAEKALTINAEGFNYRLAAELLFGNKFSRPVAQIINADDGHTALSY
jgi:CRISPR system Cascade subunit CasA